MTILINYTKPYFKLEFDKFNNEDLSIVRSLPVREYIKLEKCWKVHELAVRSLENIPAQWSLDAKKIARQINNSILKLVDYKFSSNLNENGFKNVGGKTTPRDYQLIGINFLKKAKKALLADDMGIGKTLQAIYALLEVDTKKNLIVCPATLKEKWAAEFEKHVGIKAVVIKGTKEDRIKLWNSKDKFLISNYEQLVKDWSCIPKEWDAVVADEVVFIKNHSSQRTKAIKKLKADRKIGLSGKPLETNLMEFHSIMEWIRPEVIPSYNRFKFRYIVYGWNGKIERYENLDELHNLTSPFILRRKKEDVLKELPPKIYFDYPIELSDKARTAYDAIKKEWLEWLYTQTGSNWGRDALTKTIRMRQFVEFPEIVGFNLPSVKLELLKELYESVDKLVVFCCFVDTIKILQKYFDTPHILYGETRQEERFNIVNTFNNAEKGIFILSDAGRFGLDIIGAHDIVQFGNFWNPATMVQREDRLHRIGQINVVNVHSPIIMNTIDEGIREVFLKRGKEAEDFMEGSDKISRKSLTKADYLKLVGN